MKPSKIRSKRKYYCPIHEGPYPGAKPRVCWRCEETRVDQQEHVKILDGRVLNIGGKVQPRPGCE